MELVTFTCNSCYAGVHLSLLHNKIEMRHTSSNALNSASQHLIPGCEGVFKEPDVAEACLEWLMSVSDLSTWFCRTNHFRGVPSDFIGNPVSWNILRLRLIRPHL